MFFNPFKSKKTEEIPKKEKKKFSILDKLIVSLVFGTLAYVGITFLNCNFMIPGSIEKANLLGGLKNPPSLGCEKSTSQGYNALFTLFVAILGLKGKMEE